MTVSVADLVSHVGVPVGFGAADRIDPFWDGLWGLGQFHSWLSHDLVSRQARAGLRGAGPWVGVDPGWAWKKLEKDSRYRWDRLAVLGCLSAWRTLTVEQVVAFTGFEKFADGAGWEARRLFGAGLADVGLFLSRGVEPERLWRASMVRPGRSVGVDRLLAGLTFPELVAVTGGGQFRSGGQYDRHNALSVEFGLRAAEWCDVGMVLGETFSTPDLLFGSGLGRSGTGLEWMRKSGDLTVVRRDGLRVVVELTASLSEGFQQKVDSWVRLLADNSLASSGVVVVFVGAPPHDRVRAEGLGSFRRLLHRSVTRALASFAATDQEGVWVGDRVGCVMWEDLFPGQGLVVEDFPVLPVKFPVRGGGRWRTQEVLDVFGFPFVPHDPEGMMSVIGQAGTLGGVPCWLRRGGWGDMWRWATREVAPPPQLPLDRPERSAKLPGETHARWGRLPAFPARLGGIRG